MSRQRRYQLRHSRAGLCHNCSRSVVNGGLFCEVHRRQRNLKHREWQRKKFKRKARYRKAESYKFRESKNYERRIQIKGAFDAGHVRDEGVANSTRGRVRSPEPGL